MEEQDNKCVYLEKDGIQCHYNKGFFETVEIGCKTITEKSYSAYQRFKRWKATVINKRPLGCSERGICRLSRKKVCDKHWDSRIKNLLK